MAGILSSRYFHSHSARGLQKGATLRNEGLTQGYENHTMTRTRELDEMKVPEYDESLKVNVKICGSNSLRNTARCQFHAQRSAPNNLFSSKSRSLLIILSLED